MKNKKQTFDTQKIKLAETILANYKSDEWRCEVETYGTGIDKALVKEIANTSYVPTLKSLKRSIDWLLCGEFGGVDESHYGVICSRALSYTAEEAYSKRSEHDRTFNTVLFIFVRK